MCLKVWPLPGMQRFTLWKSLATRTVLKCLLACFLHLGKTLYRVPSMQRAYEN